MRRLIILNTCLAIMATTVILMVLQGSRKPPELKLPSGATLTFFGMSKGTVFPPPKMHEGLSTDLDGNTWKHQREWPSTRWQERVYRAMPGPVRDRLPNTWRPRPSYSETIMPYPDAMKWQITGPFSREWRMTWVDRKGFESDGHVSNLGDSGGSYPINFTGALPPCHSPDVILRIRERRSGPLSHWPLIAEMRMKNPCLIPVPSTPVSKLPASVTQDGITVTMHSLVVDPKAADSGRVGARLTLAPEGSLDRWKPLLSCSDARRTPVDWTSHGGERVDGGYLANTSQCFWTDGPWLARVTLRPVENWESSASDVLRFTPLELPAAVVGAKQVIPNASGTIDGFHFALTEIEYSDHHGGSWRFAFTRSQLPESRRFTIRITTEAGREWDQEAWSGGSQVSGSLLRTYWMKPPKGPVPKFVNVAVAIQQSKTFDFHVTPSFLPGTPP